MQGDVPASASGRWKRALTGPCQRSHSPSWSGWLPGVAAGRPDTGGRDIGLYALTYFHERIDDSKVAVLRVASVAGDNLQTPIGSGRPTSWSDASLTLDVWNNCHDTLLKTFDWTGFYPLNIRYVTRQGRRVRPTR